MVELGDESGMRIELQNGLLRIRQAFDATIWVEQLVQSVHSKNQTAFEQTHQQAIQAAIFQS